MGYVNEERIAELWAKIKETFARKEDADASGSAQEALRLAKEYTDQTAEEIGTTIGEKVDKVAGKGLSENDYTTAEKQKLAGIAAGANKTIVDTALNTESTNPVQNKVVASKIDTMDSAIAQNLTAAKDYTDSAYQQSTGYTDQKVAELINGAPSTLDTLKEIADAMQENQNVVESLDSAIGSKASQAEVDGHTGNNTVHITAAERTKWNDANTKKHTHANKSVIDGITAALITAWNNAVGHISDTVGHISAAERTKWNAIDNKVDVDKGFIGYRSDIKKADLDTFVPRKSGCYCSAYSGGSDLLTVLASNRGSASALEFYNNWGLTYLHVRGTIDDNRYTAWRKIAFDTSNVASATKLETPRNINGVAFDGTKDITLPTGAQYKSIIDLSDTAVYDADTYYPVIGSPIPSTGLHRINLAVQLSCKAVWSTHANGTFTCNLDLLVKAGGWGTTNSASICLGYHYTWCPANPSGYSQMTNSSAPVLWLRGGANYVVYTDWNAVWTPRTSSYTSSEQTVAPRSSNPGLVMTKSLVFANINGNATTATKLQSARKINGIEFDGTKDINIPADDALDAASTNPVQNAVVTAKLNECFQSVSEGKSLIASAITDKGVDTAADATFTAMASNIRRINSNECYIFRAGGDAAGYFSKLNWWSNQSSLVDFGNAGIVIRNTSSARNIYASAEIIGIPEGAKSIEFVFTCAGYNVGGEFRAELLDPVSDTVLRISSETLTNASPIPKIIELDVSSHNGCRVILQITSERTTKDGNGNTTVIPYALYKFD